MQLPSESEKRKKKKCHEMIKNMRKCKKKKCGVSSPCCISLENGFRTGFEEFMHAVLRLLKDFR